jgi:hypothetical protein
MSIFRVSFLCMAAVVAPQSKPGFSSRGTTLDSEVVGPSIVVLITIVSLL